MTICSVIFTTLWSQRSWVRGINWGVLNNSCRFHGWSLSSKVLRSHFWFRKTTINSASFFSIPDNSIHCYLSFVLQSHLWLCIAPEPEGQIVESVTAAWSKSINIPFKKPFGLWKSSPPKVVGLQSVYITKVRPLLPLNPTPLANHSM